MPDRLSEQTGVGKSNARAGSIKAAPLILKLSVLAKPAHKPAGNRAMVQTRIKPYFQEVAGKTRRAIQLRLFRRNQIFGLLFVAAAILIFWLLRTNPAWIFPPGWWRP
jgi:hypothetical protein